MAVTVTAMVATEVENPVVDAVESIWSAVKPRVAKMMRPTDIFTTSVTALRSLMETFIFSRKEKQGCYLKLSRRSKTTD